MNLRAVFAALASLSALSALGCGGPPASVEGTLLGQAFTPIEAISDLTTVNLGRTAAVVLSTEQGSCDLFSKNQVRKGAQFLVLQFANVNFEKKQLEPPTGENSFDVLDPKSPTISQLTLSLASFEKLDDSCMRQPMSVDGVMGTLKLDSATDLEFSGSGDVTFNTGDHITLTFNATPCYSLGSALSSATQPACM